MTVTLDHKLTKEKQVSSEGLFSICACPCLIPRRLKVRSNKSSLQCLQDAADAPVSVPEELTEEVMKIYLLQNQDESVDEPTDVQIVIEGIIVLSSL